MVDLKSLDSSSSSPMCRYDVFLSFRGEDTRKTFTDHLYSALVSEGLITFRDDDEIERGENISSEVERAISQSKSWIIVFSKNYATSTWCLDELLMILDCRNTSRSPILPIFFDVDPSDIRKQSGSIAEAFDRHEEKLKDGMDDGKVMDKVKRWRAALTQVANLAGMTLQNQANGYESKFIQKIVEVVKDKVSRNVFSITRHLIGIDTSVKDIYLWLRNESTDVEVFAMYGIGGLGKTTIAKYAYDTSLQLFEASSFLENVREYSEKSDGLLGLQRQLLSDILKGKTPTVSNIHDGIIKIQAVLRHRKVLIVLDDVDQAEQLDVVFGMREWLYPGSKIVITTRNVHLLKAHEPCTRYAVKKLNYDNSLELFSWHAFGDNRPPECYSEHSERIIEQCQGLPLALKVLGSSLHGKKVDVWRSAIDKLKTIPHCKIQKILQISFESLQDDHDRDLFLEIACFFTGNDKSYVVGILNECKYYTIIGIENLIDRCLLKIDKYEKLKMHQSVQSMGREIIRQQSPREPGKRSRLWHYKDSLEVLKDETGTETIEGLALDMDVINTYQADLRTEAFSMMQKLRLLKINNVRLIGGYKDFPKKLKWLCWHGYDSSSIPSNFPVSNLVAIDMQSSKLEKLLQGEMLLRSLKFLNLSHCHNIIKTPNFSKSPALEQLILEDCSSLVQIDESIGMAEGLVLLNLKDCKKLKNLPRNFCMLKLLETVIISGCSNLGMLPVEMRNLQSLKIFQADGLDFGNSNAITEENASWREVIWGWRKPKIGPKLSLTSLPCSSMTRLSLVNCNLHDNAFPGDFFVAASLEYLNLSQNPIRFLPDCFKGLKKLKRLSLRECNQLEALEGLPSTNDLTVTECPLLEKITFEPGSSFEAFVYPHKCNRLFEMEHLFKVVPLGEIDAELINNCGIYGSESIKTIQIRLYNNYTGAETKCSIQGIYENKKWGKLFSIFFPGSSVPIWFTRKSNMPSISFVVSSHYKLRYLNVCFVYNFIPNWKDSYQYFYMIISNRSKDKKIIYGPACYGIPETDEFMIWLSHWKFGSHEMEAGDVVNISIYSWGSTSFEVKEVGIHVEYDELEQADVHLAKRQKIQQAYDKASECVIPVEAKPWLHGSTQLYFVGSIRVRRDALVKDMFREDIPEETV